MVALFLHDIYVTLLSQVVNIRSNTHTLRNQACKLRRECADEISDELHRNFAEIAPRTLNILSDLAENAESESVRLGATRDLLDRAGFRPVDRHEIVKEKLIDHD